MSLVKLTIEADMSQLEAIDPHTAWIASTASRWSSAELEGSLATRMIDNKMSGISSEQSRWDLVRRVR